MRGAEPGRPGPDGDPQASAGAGRHQGPRSLHRWRFGRAFVRRTRDLCSSSEGAAQTAPSFLPRRARAGKRIPALRPKTIRSFASPIRTASFELAAPLLQSVRSTSCVRHVIGRPPMALLKFEPAKELAPLCVKIARPVHERGERYREFCGALELADLVERALVYVTGR